MTDIKLKTKEDSNQNLRGNRPSWLKVRAPVSKEYFELKNLIKEQGLNTVCEEARCPNIEECWKGKTATIMLLGDTCTRACKFCAVKTGNPKGIVNKDEPRKVGEAIAKLGLDYVVLTSVNRDDLPDEGSSHFAETVEVIRKNDPNIIIEVLAPDFSGKEEFIQILANSGLHVFGHNMETVESLTPALRDRRASYAQSLQTLELAKKSSPKLITKSSLLLGVGENDDELRQTMKDLRDSGVDVVTFGQYLRPTSFHYPVKSFITPEEFKAWEKEAYSMGFLYCASGPLVRSSYKAGEFFIRGMVERGLLDNFKKSRLGLRE